MTNIELQQKTDGLAAVFTSEAAELLSLYFISVTHSAITRTADRGDLSHTSEGKVIAYTDEEGSHIGVIRDAQESQSINLRLDGCRLRTEDGRLILCAESGERFSISATGCSMTARADDNVAQVTFNGGYADIVFTLMPGIDAVSAMSTDTSVWVVDEQNLMPSFLISAYDDAGLTHLRPSKQGFPVLSTMPVPASTDPTDIQILDKGEPVPSRTVYFRVLANQTIPDGITPVLRMYRPIGLERIAGPEIIALTSTATANVYTGSYVVKRTDYQNYVDGFAYLSVYVPLSITVSLPIDMTIGTYTSSLEDDDLNGY